MTANPTMFRRVYDAVALFAVLNLAALGGVCAYMLGTGVVDGERLRGMVDVLRASDEPEEDAQMDEAAGAESEATDEPETAAVAAQAGGQSVEVLRREAERVKVELDQKVALTNSILLRVSQERDAFKREREAAAKREAESKVSRETAGFEKEVELFSAMSPKAAIGYLLDAGRDPDEAAKILVDMDARKAKKIIEAAKQPDQIQRMKTILTRIREVAPERSTDLQGAGT